MGKLEKKNFDENVHVYVDKTKSEILNSLSEVLKDNDDMCKCLTKAGTDIEKLETTLISCDKEVKGLKSIMNDYEAIMIELRNAKDNYHTAVLSLSVVILVLLIILTIIIFHG